jgi:hypothetical protein
LETGKMQKRQPKMQKSLAFCPYHKNSRNFWQFQCCFEFLVSVLPASWRIEFLGAYRKNLSFKFPWKRDIDPLTIYFD